VELEPTALPAAELEEWIFGFPAPDSGYSDEEAAQQHPCLLLPDMQDRTPLMVIQAIMPSLYFLGSPLFSNAVCTMLRLTRDRGLSPQAAFAFSVVVIVFWAGQHKLRESFLCGLVADILIKVCAPFKHHALEEGRLPLTVWLAWWVCAHPCARAWLV
jgi:hypothetical protein